MSGRCPRLVLFGVGALLACGGCGANQPPAGDPLLICGDNLAGGYVVPTVVDATAGSREITVRPAESNIFIRLTDGCAHGVHLTIDPPDATTVVNRARASDGLPVAVELRIRRPGFVIAIERADHTRSSFRVVRSGT